MEKKNELPKQVVVLGQPFRVELATLVDCAGETVGDIHLIRIAGDMNMARKWRTLLHEYIHATLHINGLGNVMDGDVEEVVAQSLEYSITQFIYKYGKQFNEAVAGDRHE